MLVRGVVVVVICEPVVGGGGGRKLGMLGRVIAGARAGAEVAIGARSVGLNEFLELRESSNQTQDQLIATNSKHKFVEWKTLADIEGLSR